MVRKEYLCWIGWCWSSRTRITCFLWMQRWKMWCNEITIDSLHDQHQHNMNDALWNHELRSIGWMANWIWMLNSSNVSLVVIAHTHKYPATIQHDTIAHFPIIPRLPRTDLVQGSLHVWPKSTRTTNTTTTTTEEEAAATAEARSSKNPSFMLSFSRLVDIIKVHIISKTFHISHEEKLMRESERCLKS